MATTKLGAREELDAYGQFWSLTLGFVAPFAVKAAVKLDIFNIVFKLSEGGAILEKISQELQARHNEDAIQVDRLSRLLRFLVFKGVLSLDRETGAYGLTPLSKLLLSERKREEGQFSVEGILSFCTSETNQLSWQHVDSVIKKPGEANAFEEAHGMGPREYIAKHPEFQQIVEEFRLSFPYVAIAHMYGGFNTMKKLVDVGGGSGSFVAEIKKLHPHIQAVNFDLPQALSNATPYPGVENVAGNAMESIPSCDGILMKNFMHMFSDADAATLLKNCHSALEAGGRVVICDMVMDENKELHLQLDMLFLSGAQRYSRTREEWERLLKESGFESVKFFESAPFSFVEGIRHQSC